ncbi:STAS domain-containing protein [Fulvimarina sp. 2208YS6-2-32]|uniref:STAS domain-containing protein n=1 Tax=Fulvimarina uroteuthidis TaxID=3098149 RepID=A0ABU5I5V6_9HYPH|nr:STAS domain-containing protein [Fulvimarina sp. 2208YS6-2-32]MDY8110776.1 STAS domain-containing protein [Fulvimarina sp. 2208YS6-2-32]
MTQVKSNFPIITIGGCVIVAIRDDLDDQDIVALQDQLVEEVARKGAHGVIIDISSLEIVDTFAGRMLGAMAQMARMMNARTIVVGMRPAVAMTLVELGMTLDGVETALTADRAIKTIMSGRA